MALQKGYYDVFINVSKAQLRGLFCFHINPAS